MVDDGRRPGHIRGSAVLPREVCAGSEVLQTCPPRYALIPREVPLVDGGCNVDGGKHGVQPSDKGLKLYA